MRTFALLTVLLFALSAAGPGYAAHKEEKGTVKGTITRMEPSGYDITVKDDKGIETKVNVRDVGGVKVGDSVVIKDGKVSPAVKPKTGGY